MTRLWAIKIGRDISIAKVRNVAIRFPKAFICLSLAALSGCALGGKEGHLSGWDTYVRLAALETYTYAQMATNAYLSPECVKGTGTASCNDQEKLEKFDLGSDIEVLCPKDDDEIGFAYTVFARKKAGQTREIIIAYRGTEKGFLDWRYGNLFFAQNRKGLKVYQDWKKKAAAMGGNVEVTVTGHSLGGGIATYVSLVEEGAKCYVFNASPRFRREATPVPDNRRVSIVEFGEINKVLRIFGRSPTQTYISIGCSTGGPINPQHSMRKLAECLTAAAAWELPKVHGTPADARASLIRNRIALPKGLDSAPRANF